MHAWIKNSKMRGKPLPKKVRASSTMRSNLPIINQEIAQHSGKSRKNKQKRMNSDVLSETSGIQSIQKPRQTQKQLIYEGSESELQSEEQLFTDQEQKQSENHSNRKFNISGQVPSKYQLIDSKLSSSKSPERNNMNNPKPIFNPESDNRKNKILSQSLVDSVQFRRGFEFPVSLVKSPQLDKGSSEQPIRGINQYLFSTKKAEEEKKFMERNYRPFKESQTYEESQRSSRLLQHQKSQINSRQKLNSDRMRHPIFKKKQIQSRNSQSPVQSDDNSFQQQKKVIQPLLMTNQRDPNKFYQLPRGLTTGSLIRQNRINPRNYQSNMRNSNNSRAHNHSRQHVISIVQYCAQQVGIACYNLSTGQVTLCQMIQRMIYTKVLSTIYSYYPQEIVYSETQANTLLLKELHDKFPGTNFRSLKRNLFNEDKGFKIYEQRGNKEESNPNNHFLAFSALNALFSHLEQSMNTKFSLASMKIRWHVIEDVMIIDRQTIINLEIFMNRVHKNNEGSFFLNFNCFTIGGTRMLRMNILQPFCDIQKIRRRHKLLQSLFDDSNLFGVLERQFPKYKHYESITSKFVQIPPFNNVKILKTYLRQILHISQFSFQLKILKQKLSNWKQVTLIKNLQELLGSQKLKSLRKVTQEYFVHQILNGYQNQFHRSNKKSHFIFLFKIQKFQDQFIELYRAIYSQSLESLRSLFNQLNNKSGLQLKLLQTPVRGYYLSAKRGLNLREFSRKIQDQIQNITENSNSVTFTTGKFQYLNNRIKQNQEKLLIKSQELLLKVIKEIQKNLDILFDINYYISTIDVVLSFYKLIKANASFNFTKPIFNREVSCFKTKSMKTSWKRQRFLRSPQEINLNVGQPRPIILFQAKLQKFNHLDFLYSIGYTVILSQIGCFVPADSVELSIFDLLISKSSVSLESVQFKLSHFQSEMVNINNIMQNIQNAKRTLFLAEEFVKGTQYQDQCAISAAFLDQISESNIIAFGCVNDHYMLQLLQKAPFVQILKGDKLPEQTETQMVQLMKKLNFSNRFIQDYANLEISDNTFVPNIFQDYVYKKNNFNTQSKVMQQQKQASEASKNDINRSDRLKNQQRSIEQNDENNSTQKEENIGKHLYRVNFDSSDQSQQAQDNLILERSGSFQSSN